MLTYTYPTVALPYLVTNIFDPYIPSASSKSVLSSNLNPVKSIPSNLSTVSTQTDDLNYNEFTLILSTLQFISISDEFGIFLKSLQPPKHRKSIKCRFYALFKIALAFCFKRTVNQYIALVGHDSEEFYCHVLNCRTCELTSDKKIIINSPKNFVKNIVKNFGHKGFKAIFLNIFQAKPTGFRNIVEFCKRIKAKFDELKIPCYFITNQNFNITCLLIETKILAEEGEEIIYLSVSESNNLWISLFAYTENGYVFIRCYWVEIDEDKNGKIIREKILKQLRPKSIVAFFEPAKMETIKFLEECVFVSSDNFIPVKTRDNFQYYAKTFLNEKSKWMYDNSYTKYHIIPFINSEYVTFIESGKNVYYRTVINDEELLPVTKKSYIPNFDLNYSVGFIDVHTDENVILKKISYTKNAHKHEITISIDDQYFPTIQVKPIILDEISKFPVILDKAAKTNIPIIGFYELSSIICYFNDQKNGYEFFEAWKGQFGRPLSLCFEKEKPIYGELAVKGYKKKPSSVVFDLLSLLYREDKYNNDTAGFMVTKDSENSTMIEFELFDGTKKAASPTFLMALALKQHIKVIKCKTGKKPEILGFYLFEKPNSIVEQQKIKEGLEESCKLLKINSIMLEF